MTLSDLKGHSPIVSRFQSGLLCSCTLVYTISTNSVSRGPSTVDDSLFPIKCLYSDEERAFGFIECALKISNGQSLKFHNECYYSVTSVLIYIHTFKAVVIPDGCIVEHSNSGKKSFDSILATESIFFDSIRQSDKCAACTLIFK